MTRASRAAANVTEQVYEHLMTYLPASETKNYLTKSLSVKLIIKKHWVYNCEKHLIAIGVCFALLLVPLNRNKQKSKVVGTGKSADAVCDRKSSRLSACLGVSSKSDKGLASSACVDWSGNMAVDRPQAVAAAQRIWRNKSA